MRCAWGRQHCGIGVWEGRGRGREEVMESVFQWAPITILPPLGRGRVFVCLFVFFF